MTKEKKVKNVQNLKRAGQFVVAGLILTTAGGLAVNAAPFKGSLNNSAVVSAIKSGDLNAYKEAVKSEESTRLNQKLDSLTQDDLNKMKLRLENEQKREDAIKNNDWNSFNVLQTTETNINGKNHVPHTITQDEFNKMVESYKISQEYQLKLNDALKNNDQATFTSLMKEMRTKMDTFKPARNNTDGTTDVSKTRPEPTAEQKTEMDQKMWERALTEYKANGTFEVKGFGMGAGKDIKDEIGRRGRYGERFNKMGAVKDADVQLGASTSTAVSGA